jgi:glucokinase
VPRPGTHSPDHVPAHALTLDVGGSHVTAARVSLSQRRVEREARRTLAHTEGLERLLNGWAEAALEVAGDHGGAFSHVGLAVPSPFDMDGGVSLMQHKFPGLFGVPLRPLLARRFTDTPLHGLPILFGNDADLFALGEWWAGGQERGQGEHLTDDQSSADRMIGLTLGTGLGSGFVAEGKVVTTGDTVPPGGELWNTPYRGAVAETFACGAALPRAWAALGGSDELGGQGEPAARDLAALASAGDESALKAFQVFGSDLAGLLWPWVKRFGARRVVLGGSVSNAFDLFGPVVQSCLDLHARIECRVQVSDYFERAALLGAAALCIGAPFGDTVTRGESK